MNENNESNNPEMPPTSANQITTNPTSIDLADKLRQIAQHQRTPSILSRLLPALGSPLDRQHEQAEGALAKVVFDDWIKTAALRADKGRQALAERLSRLLAELKIRERGDLITFAARDHTRTAEELERESNTVIAILRDLETKKNAAQTETERTWFERRQSELLRRADEKFARLLDGYDRACDDYLAM